jgi:ERCC4-type nuclease
MTHIIIDDRERAIFPYLDQPSAEYKIPYKVQRINVGDYAICTGAEIKIIIERKTWTDLAASFRDGRKENVAKLISARQETRCVLVYLIEGHTCPRPGALFGRIPYANLRAHLDHLAFRDNIHIINTCDIEYSARRLFEIARNIPGDTPGLVACQSLPRQVAKPEDTPQPKPATGGLDEPPCPDSPRILQANANLPATNPVGNLDVLQTTRHSAVNIQIQMLQCLPAVGSITAPLLYAAGVTIKQIVTLAPADFMAKFAAATYPDGRSLKKVIGKICKPLSFATMCRVLECIPSVTRKNAAALLGEVDFGDLFIDFNIPVLAAVQTSQKIGTARANKIYQACYGEKPQV